MDCIITSTADSQLGYCMHSYRREMTFIIFPNVFFRLLILLAWLLPIIVRHCDASICHVYIDISRILHAGLNSPTAGELNSVKITYQHGSNSRSWLAKNCGWLKVAPSLHPFRFFGGANLHLWVVVEGDPPRRGKGLWMPICGSWDSVGDGSVLLPQSSITSMDYSQ